MSLNAALLAGLSLEVRQIIRHGGGEVVSLSRGPDGVEKVDVPCVERWHGLIHELWNRSIYLPPTSHIVEGMMQLDESHDHKVANLGTKGQRLKWAMWEAEKIHAILSYTARLCRRSGTSKSMKVASLKKLWRKMRRAQSGELLEASL